jgi:hypothetical protein
MATSPQRLGDTRAHFIDPALIARTLLELGGAAHLTVLFEKLQPKLSPHLDTPEPCLADLLQTLNAYRSPYSHQANAEALFFQPFGDNSYRWGLCTGVRIDRL